MGTVKIVLVTGTRDNNYFEPVSVYQALSDSKPDLIVHGDCPTGIDALAKAYADGYNIAQIPMPARWDELGKRAGPDRNYDMCKLISHLMVYGHTAVCLAFPKGTNYSGTRNCMSSAEKWQIEVINCGDEDEV